MVIQIDENRTAKLTTEEFNSIPRNEGRDIIDDLAMLQIYMTPKQRDSLSSDDWSRAEENDEEMRCMMAEFL